MAPDAVNEYFIYDGDQLLATVSGATGSISETYLWGATGLNMSSFAAYEFDPQGNAVGIDVSGTHLATAMYDGYGQFLGSSGGYQGGNPPNPTSLFGTYADPIGYKGQYGYFTDQETGLIYCQNRYYDPHLGRWINQDPAGAEGGINVYEYCDNNPVMGADPSGLGPGQQMLFRDPDILDSSRIARILKQLEEGSQDTAGGAGGTSLLSGLTRVGAVFGLLTLTKQLHLEQNDQGFRVAQADFERRRRLWEAAGPEQRADLEKYVDIATYAALRRAHGKVEIHHLLPQEFEAWFNSRGIDIDDIDYLYVLPAGTHKDIHGRFGGLFWVTSWNKRWERFRDQNPLASPGQIRSFMFRLMGEFHL